MAYLNPNREEYDAFCPLHAASAAAHYDGVMHRFNTRKPPAQAPALSKANKRKAPAVRVEGGDGGGVSRQIKRHGRSTATPESVAAEKALLRMSFLGQADPSDADDDLSQHLPMRVQRHEVMAPEDVNKMVQKKDCAAACKGYALAPGRWESRQEEW